MTTSRDWSVAFARQAAVGLETFKLLRAQPDLPKCQFLHALQMACEQACKAYLCRHGTDPAHLQSSHAYISKTLAHIAVQWLGDAARARKSHLLVRKLRILAREIELLHPAVDTMGERPDNCEYPWEARQRVLAPRDYDFPHLTLLEEPAGWLLLRILASTIADLQ